MLSVVIYHLRMMTLSKRIRSYTEMIQFSDFLDRFNYLHLRAAIGESTFGSERYFNQHFYRSQEWKRVRDVVITRDLGRDLGVEGREIFDRIYIHHMNPITVEDLEAGDPDILNPEYLIATTHNTHNAIHFGDETGLIKPLVDRRPGDTHLW